MCFKGFFMQSKVLTIAIPISLLIGMNLAYKRLKEFGAKHAGCKKSKS
jgi:hypothetical protein